MTGADRLDACRDAGALLSATASHDDEAVRVVLDYSDNREVCEVLAVVLAATCRGYSASFLDDLCRELRSIG